MSLWAGNAQASAFVDKTTKQISDLQRQLETEQKERTRLTQSVDILVQARQNTPPSPSANQLYNGELGHSVNSWFDSAYTTDDKSKECAHFFSHDAMTVGQNLDLTDARTSSTNHALKHTSHSAYDAAFSDWDRQTGQARVQKLTTIDTPLPQNSVEAGMTVYVNMIMAKRQSFIEIPETLRFFCGLYDDSPTQFDWLKGSTGLKAAPEDNTGTTEQRYVLFIQTDRGYSILSPEITVLNGYSDAEFAAGKEIDLTWQNAAGYLYVQIWRFTPSSGEYNLLFEASSGTSTYIDNNAREILDVPATGYPAGSETERKALYFTNTANMVGLALNGGTWDSLKAPIGVPDNYDKTNTTERQWLRMGASQACNLFVTGCTTDGGSVIESSSAVFEAEYTALFSGLVAEVYDEFDALLLTTTVSAYTDSTHLTLDNAVVAGTNRKLRIVGGGFHGILLDKIHLGFQDNVSFAPNPFDARELQPVAAPSSGQGTVGGGGIGGGGLCVVEDSNIRIGNLYAKIEDILVQNLERFMRVVGESSAPNSVDALDVGFQYTRTVRTKNGCEIECSESHRFRMNVYDQVGTPLNRLRVGDVVQTNIDGRDEFSAIVHISARSMKKKRVYTPRLRGGSYYLAGNWKPTFLQKILIKLKLLKIKNGKIYSHNLKPHTDISEA